MSNAAGGLSDALRQLSDGVRELPIEQEDHEFFGEPETPEALAPRRSRSSRASAATTASPKRRTSGSSATASSKRRPTASKVANTQNLKLKQLSIPVLLVTGVILVLPGIWSILILMDHEIIWHERGGAKAMATAMLASWPLALFMFGGAAFFYWQVQRIKQDMKAADRAQRIRGK